MKKTGLIIAFIAIVMQGYAQENGKNETQRFNNEIYVGYGLLNSVSIIAPIFDIGATVLTGGYFVNPGEYKFATPFLGYRHWFGKHFSFGGVLAFDKNTVQIRTQTNGPDGGVFEERTRNYTTLAAEVGLYYVNSPGFQLYSSAGFGTTVVYVPKSQISTRIWPNMHLNLLGMRFGGRVGGFLEFGFGYKGIINAGLSVQF